MVLTVTQLAWDGVADRTFTYHPTAATLADRLERIRRGYNVDGGRVVVRLDGRDITADIDTPPPPTTTTTEGDA